MRLKKIHVKNYRCLKDFELPIEDYSVFVGPNGSGKSSVLYALDWFFNGGHIDPTDIHDFTDSDDAVKFSEAELQSNPALDTVEVMVTFKDLTDGDKEKLASYGRGDTVTFRRSWRHSEQKEKVVGHALQGPEFSTARSIKNVTDLRPVYKELRTNNDGLPDLGGKPAKEIIHSALADWENKPENLSKLVSIDDADANHMFGINGPNVIKECIRMVLVPASGDIIHEVSKNKKGSALNELIGGLMQNATAAARQAWIEQHSEIIEELSSSMKESAKSSTGLQAERINERLVSLVPNATIDFSTNVPEWVPNPSATVSTDVTIDGTTNNVSRQGHGIQRAVMIAMFQSLMPDEKLVKSTHKTEEEETEEDAEVRLQQILKDLPALIICIEEPEIYQHPVRARSFARVLSDLAQQANAQVLLATHSPYFVAPSQFESLRRFLLSSGLSSAKYTTLSDIVSATSLDADKVRKTIETRLPSTFSEGFFSDGVALVEGITDKVVLEAIAEKLGTPFDTLGVSVLEMSGKEGIYIPKTILDKLGTPNYVVVDGDALGASRDKVPGSTEEAQAHNSHKKSTESILQWLPSSTALVGTLPYLFEAPTLVSNHYTIWNEDIEEELSGWPSFMAGLLSLEGVLRSKDMLLYKEAVELASVDDIPESLVKCVKAIIDSNY